MAAVEKFLFGRDFEDEADQPVAPESETRRAPEPEPEPEPTPTYSEEDLAAAVEEARQAARAEGVAEGRRQAEAEADAAQTQALQGVARGLEALAEGRAEHDERRDREQLELAVQLLQRLFPALTRRHGMTEIEAVIRDSLDRLREEPRVVVRVADGRLDALRERIDALSAKAGFEGKVVLLADEEIADGDVRVEWADGGAERDSARLWREIEKAVQRALGPRPVPTARGDNDASHGASGEAAGGATTGTAPQAEGADVAPDVAPDAAPDAGSDVGSDAGASGAESDTNTDMPADATPAARRSA